MGIAGRIIVPAKPSRRLQPPGLSEPLGGHFVGRRPRSGMRWSLVVGYVTSAVTPALVRVALIAGRRCLGLAWCDRDGVLPWGDSFRGVDPAGAGTYQL